MKIILVRHGEPQIDKTAALSSSDFSEWTINYDIAGLKHDSIASHKLIALANTTKYFVSRI